MLASVRLVWLSSDGRGVAQPATIGRSLNAVPLCPAELFALSSCGVGHPIQPLPPVRRSDARSAQIGSPAGISQVFQVKANSGEPFASILARNLLSKDRCRTALGDEPVKSGPQVPLVGVALSFSSARKRLTGTGAGPDSAGVSESCPAQGKRPSANSGEEMALAVSFEFIGFDLRYASAINIAGGYLAFGDQFAQPRASLLVYVVVKVHSEPEQRARPHASQRSSPGFGL